MGESATSLYADAQGMLDRIVGERWLTARGVAGLWPCHRHDDDVYVTLPHEEHHRSPDGAAIPAGFTSPTSTGARAIARACRSCANRSPSGRAAPTCASPISSTRLATGSAASRSASTASSPTSPRTRRTTTTITTSCSRRSPTGWRKAFAETLHAHVRRELWGYAPDEQLTNEALVREQYRGIRPAPGYPACPEHSLKRVLFDLLDAETNVGLELTESFAMLPTAAVSGFYFGHAQAEYFGVARIGEDQVADYAARRGVDMAQATRWLRPNLD